MPRSLLVTALLLLFCVFTYAQDAYVRTDGTIVKPIKIDKIGRYELWHWYGQNPSRKSESLRKVAYVIQSGKRLEFNPFLPGVTDPIASSLVTSVSEIPINDVLSQTVDLQVTGSRTINDLYLRGKMDANTFYHGHKGAGTATLLTTMFGGVVIGLVPAIACSATPPKPHTLGIRDASLAQNPQYFAGYVDGARRKKSRKVWGNFAIGTGVLVIAAAVLASSAR
nr:hypothetical protein [uncultured Arsenicibacter sp.]